MKITKKSVLLVVMLFIVGILSGCGDYEYYTVIEDNHIITMGETDDIEPILIKNNDKMSELKAEEWFNLMSEDFVSEIEKYDDEYFENKMLVLVLKISSTSDVKYTVNDVTLNDTTVSINIDEKLPNRGNDEMCGYAIFIEIEKKEDVNIVVVN